MFQSIKYLNSTYDNKTKLYHYHYKITDSDFISTSTATANVEVSSVPSSAAAVIKEYENTNYSHKEIVSNLFLLNMFLLTVVGYKDLDKILEYQHKYIVKENFPETNFNEKYYDDLLNYTKKMMIVF